MGANRVHRRITTLLLAASALASVVLVLPRMSAQADPYTRAFVNGRLVPVYFNDGDTFRIIEGEFRGMPARLAGFNTLESYGPVHQWGDWHPYELYVIAKQATYNGRRGTWHCTTNGDRDGYGRLLTECPDLAVDQIRRGFAHALEVDDTPSPPAYIRAQQAAIANRRGIWAHGVPDFIMTSLHSMHEDPGRAYHYNRLVSTLDGHSESRQHRETYHECQWVCDTETRVDEERVRAAARRLRESPTLAPRLTELFNANLVAAVSRFVRKDELPASVPAEVQEDLLAHLRSERDRGLLGETTTARGSCGLYVEFHRRYGPARAQCLRGHGNWHPTGGH